jgi:hypothetical protein
MKGKGIHHHGHVSHEHKGTVMHHHGRKDGGKLVEPSKKGVVASDKGASDVYAGGSSDVVKEARKMKKGGKACRKEGAKGRLDRKPRAKGGKVGAEMRPLSEANAMKPRPGGDVDAITNG